MRWLLHNPIFIKARILEARNYRRSPSSFWLKQMGLVWCVLIPVGWTALMSLPPVLDAVSPKVNWTRFGAALNQLGENSMTALAFSYFLVLVAAIHLALNSTSASVTTEREKKTFESLQSTMLSAAEIVAGRMTTGLYPLFRELAILSPVVIGLGLLAGRAGTALSCLGLLASTALAYGAVGLWSSYRSRSTALANRMAVGIAGLMLIGPVLLWGLTDSPQTMLLHPAYAAVLVDREGLLPVLLVTAFHICATAWLWLDCWRMERSAVRV